jgi:hypothetical protein
MNAMRWHTRLRGDRNKPRDALALEHALGFALRGRWHDSMQW